MWSPGLLTNMKTAALCLLLAQCFASRCDLAVDAAADTVVYPSLLESRDGDGRKVVAVTDQLTLTLRKSQLLGRDITLSRTIDGVLHEEVINADLLGLHEDPVHMSSLLVHELQDGVQLRGALTPGLHIEPLYHMERSAGPGSRMAHRIYEVQNDPFADPSTVSNIRLRREDINERSHGYSYGGPRLSETFWAEVYVMCGYSHGQKFSSIAEELTYVVILMNSVGLRFSHTRSPKIQFRLVGVHSVTEEENARYCVKVQSPSEASALDAVKKFLKEKNMNVDMAYYITASPITETKDGRKGFSEQGGLCTENNVAIGWDDGKVYLGVDVAVRQMARLLGAPYDDETQDCKAEDGYIMGNLSVLTDNRYKFSQCSIQGMRGTLRDRMREDRKLKREQPWESDESDEKGCFGNPHLDILDDVSDKIPGQVVDDTTFCRAVMVKSDPHHVHPCEGWFQNTREWRKGECITRCCYGSGWTFWQQIPYKSLDGAKCYLTRKVCYAGECVDRGTPISSFGGHK